MVHLISPENPNEPASVRPAPAGIVCVHLSGSLIYSRLLPKQVWLGLGFRDRAKGPDVVGTLVRSFAYDRANLAEIG